MNQNRYTKHEMEIIKRNYRESKDWLEKSLNEINAMYEDTPEYKKSMCSIAHKCYCMIRTGMMARSDRRMNIESPPTPAQKVICIETGEVFESMRAAARAKNGKPGAAISTAVKMNIKAYGYHWRLA